MTDSPMNLDGSYKTLTPKQFQKQLQRLTPEERAYVLRMRQELGIDKETV